MIRLSDFVDRWIRKSGAWISAAYLLLIAVIILQVTLRYGLRSGLVTLEELQWHLYAIGVMFGISYAQATNSHVRVDAFARRFSIRTRRIIEILGLMFLAMPFIMVIFLHSLDFVAVAWRVNERSDSPSGLPARWAIKSVIPLSFGILILAVISRIIRETAELFYSPPTLSRSNKK